MLEIYFYYNQSDESDIVDLIDELDDKAQKGDKDARVNIAKIREHINALKVYGKRLGMPFTKYLGDDLWELRPKRNRIIFFYWKGDKVVLLHHFVKKTRKTPKREIETAKRRKKDWVSRYE